MSQGWTPRQRLFVNPSLQGRVISHVAWYWCVYHIALWHAMFLYYYLQYRRELLAGGPVQTFSELYCSFAAGHIAVIICAAVVLPVVLWDVLKLTHRIAGPLVRFTSVLRQLSKGESVGRFHLRRGDLLVGLQDALNDFLASPYAPHFQKAPPGNIGSRQLNSEIAGILGDIREIQASLCRVYNPELDFPQNSAEWVNDLHRPTNHDSFPHEHLGSETGSDKVPEPRVASPEDVTRTPTAGNNPTVV